MLSKIKHGIGSALAAYLSKPLPGYTRVDTLDIEQIQQVMKPGDVLLVEGNSRVSSAIKYLTQSSWSHACLYIGGTSMSAASLSLVEADLRAGVQYVSLDKYKDSNLRICRPEGLENTELEHLLAFVKSKIGYQYDLQNIRDLLRYLIQKPPVPSRYRRALIGLGSADPTRAICSTLLAQAFQSIAYPILPIQEKGVDGGNDHNLEVNESSSSGEVPRYYQRHFTHFVPRDFDLSPYFKIVKPSLEIGFNFHNMPWHDAGAEDT